MHIRTTLAVAVPLLAGCASTPTVPEARGFVSRSISVGGAEYRYVLYVPESLDLSKPAPLVVFLHGKGECGTDNTRQLAVGLPPAVRSHPERWPCLILIPQKPDAEKQWEDYEAMVMAELRAVEQDYRVDLRRVSLTGLSQGGHGTWVFGARYPGTWSALVPVCGYGDAGEIAPKITGLPVHAFHGGKDDMVPPARSETVVRAIRDAGGATVMLTIFPDADHNSWDLTYNDPALPAWLLSQKRLGD